MCSCWSNRGTKLRWKHCLLRQENIFYLVVLCSESLKTYGRISFSFGHILMLHTSLVLIGKSELLVTFCCFTKTYFMCVDFGFGAERVIYVPGGKKRCHCQIMNGRNWNIHHLLKLLKRKKKKKKREKMAGSSLHYLNRIYFFFFFSQKKNIFVPFFVFLVYFNCSCYSLFLLIAEDCVCYLWEEFLFNLLLGNKVCFPLHCEVCPFYQRIILRVIFPWKL